MIDVLIRKKEKDPGDRHPGEKTICRWRQRLDGCIYKPGSQKTVLEQTLLYLQISLSL